MAGRGSFPSPGLTTHWGVVIKLYCSNPQRLLSNNTCHGFQLLRSDSCSWLLHLLGNVELAGSKSQGSLLLAGKSHFSLCYKLHLTLYTCWGISFSPYKPNLTLYNCRGIFESFTGTDCGFQKKNLVQKDAHWQEAGIIGKISQDHWQDAGIIAK